MEWTPTILFSTTVVVAAYRVVHLRKQQVSTARALGFGLDHKPFVNMMAGTAISLIAISLIFFVERTAGLIYVTRIGPPTALLDDLLTTIAVPLTEEFIFRCAILGALLLILHNTPVALGISAFLFGVGHAGNAHATILSVINTTLGGLVYSVAYAATQRIWLPFGLHLGWNYMQGRFFGFPLSGAVVHPPPLMYQHDVGPALLTGGGYGPEGGVIGLGARVITLALVGTWLAFQHRREHAVAARAATASG